MKLVSNNPSVTPLHTASVADRTFTLSPEAYAIVQHIAGERSASTEEALNAALLTLDAMMLQFGLNGATASVNEDGGKTIYSFIPKATPIAVELKGV